MSDPRILSDAELAAIRERVGPTCGWAAFQARFREHRVPDLVGGGHCIQPVARTIEECDTRALVAPLLDHIEATAPPAATEGSADERA